MLAARPALAYITYLDIPIGLPVDTSEAAYADQDLDIRAYLIANLVREMPYLTVLVLRNQNY